MFYRAENGRSLLEIIAVMAIMGVFTVASIAAFQAGLNSVRAKYIIEQVQLRVEEVVANSELSKGHKKTVYTPEYVNKSGQDKYGYSFKTVNATQGDKTMAFMLLGNAARSPTVQVEISGKISSGICTSLKGKMAILGNVEKATTDRGVDILKKPCPEDIQKITVYVKRKIKKIVRSSTTGRSGQTGSSASRSSSGITGVTTRVAAQKKCNIENALSCDPLVCDESNGYYEFEDERGKCQPCPAGCYCE